MSAKKKATSGAAAKVDRVKGAVKEKVGRAVGNARLTGEGRGERSKGDLRDAASRVRHAFKR
ncbi:CsbD family protein [Streptomyces sp. NPDC047928]|uniref:CsbD family protein n=1 Tax=unclassified Streptomyces TaxID=2593676 RepID=UPI003720B052